MSKTSRWNETCIHGFAFSLSLLPTVPTTASPFTVLIVDDDDDCRRISGMALEHAGFAVLTANDGHEGLRLAKNHEPDIILMDIAMPVMDGLTLLAELRNQQSEVRAIIVSAYGDMINIRTAMNRGAFDFVTKPVDLNDLEITIRKTLDEIARVHEIDRRRAAAERARLNLSRYFSPNLVELLAARDEPLGAVRRQTVAVLFVDIVGFTKMAEEMAPEAVVTMLREFHERMTAQIFECGGTVEKYIGDEIFAVFSLPNASPGDALNALRCAERMIAELELGNDDRKRQGEPPLAIGIGLNYGLAVIGDVGSEQSLSFTVIGDTVNTASP